MTMEKRQSETLRLEERSDDAKIRRSFERRIVLMLGVLLLMIGAVGAGELSRIQTAAKNTPVLERLDDQTRIIKDTVDPGGKRFKQSRESGAASVQAVNEITVLAAYCAKVNNDLPEIQQCVRDEYLRLHPPSAP